MYIKKFRPWHKIIYWVLPDVYISCTKYFIKICKQFLAYVYFKWNIIEPILFITVVHVKSVVLYKTTPTSIFICTSHWHTLLILILLNECVCFVPGFIMLISVNRLGGSWNYTKLQLVDGTKCWLFFTVVLRYDK